MSRGWFLILPLAALACGDRSTEIFGDGAPPDAMAVDGASDPADAQGCPTEYVPDPTTGTSYRAATWGSS